MNTKDKGDIAEAKVLADLLNKSKKVLVPWGDNLPYDLVVDDNSKFIRIQVKHGNYKNGIVQANVCHSLNHRNKSATIKSYHGEVDVIAIYSSALDETFYVHIKDCGNRMISLRIEDPKWMMNTIRWAKDYKKFPGVSSNG